MKEQTTTDKMLKIFNRNIPVKEQYTFNEIKMAFSKTVGNKREKFLYKRFFKECSTEEFLEELKYVFGVKIQRLKQQYETFSNDDKIEFGSFWSTRFRLPKVKGMFISRCDEKYTEIDSFEKYELTPCIAYEMAIRNNKVKKLLSRYEKISTMLKDDKYFFKMHMSKKLFAFAYGYEDEKEIDEEYPKYEKLYEQKQANYEKLIKEDYKKFIDDYIDMCTELESTTLMDLQTMIEDELINDYLIYPEGYHRKFPCAEKAMGGETITNSHKEECVRVLNDENAEDGIGMRYEQITYKEFIKYQSIFVLNNEYKIDINNIIPNFKRQVNDQNQPILPINFSLPLDEIVEYITKVKEHINPKTPFELLGKELEKGDDLTCLPVMKGESPQKKLSDMLYVYDMKKKGYFDKEIINEVDGYHEKTAYLRNYINTYYDVAKEYIENEKYKELITGKSE
ncbi:hypothetical protein FJR48_06405 [Sulfurimonas lithotrophica]|uniref:Uncharacterized protein n=1 Tax=Sulfurimonas lithotrophica TaxID=2590022 RepID=A0A5P8P0Y5_9BACT|nr:hypothetical protein [Sulfurimonas lithotrophica]QFR49375.1 hypothetical protein FJR48_06405 [Sulfurimonas lithotrophica]